MKKGRDLEKKKLANQKYYALTHKNLDGKTSRKLIIPLLDEEHKLLEIENAKLRRERILFNIKQQSILEKPNIDSKNEQNIDDYNENIEHYKNELQIFINKYGNNFIELKLVEFENLSEPYNESWTNYEKCNFYDSLFKFIDNNYN